MPNERKRLEAMSELFESEKSYISDMKIWSVEFRRFFLNCDALTPQKRYLLNNLVFLNTENIVDIHEKIMNEIAMRNEKIRETNLIDYKKDDINQKIDLENYDPEVQDTYKDLTYVDIYKKHLEQFEIYGFYIHRLPKIEYFLDKEIAINKNFGNQFRTFLTDTGYIVMGYKHFIYRPSQKLARYPLLFAAIRKNSRNNEIIEKLTYVIDYLTKKTKGYDQELGKGQNYFNLYKILTNLEYKDYVQMRSATSLFLMKRQIIQILSNVYVRSHYRYKASTYRLYLFDHLILVVDPVSKVFGEKLYIADDPLSLNKYKVDLNDNVLSVKDSLDHFKSKIVMKEIDGNNTITFLFKIEGRARDFIKKINEVQNKLTSIYDENIKIEMCAYIAKSKVKNVCFSDHNFIGNSYLEPDEQQIANYQKEIDETRKNESTNTDNNDAILRKNSVVQRHTQIKSQQNNKSDSYYFGSIINGIEPVVDGQMMLFFCIDTFIYMKTWNTLRKIYYNKVKNLIYVHEYKILVFIDNTRCCYASVSPDIRILLVSFVTNKTDMFWYGKTVEKSFLVIRLCTKSSSSYLQLYEIVKEADIVKISLSAQLYVGAYINQIVFFNTKLIVCCPDFEVVDMNTLNTHTFINAGDPTVEWFMQGLNQTHACDIFKIEKGLYIVCNNKIGFFVNEYGLSHEESIYFAFYTEPTSFRLIGKYLIVLSISNAVIYDVKTGDIVAYIVKDHLNFISCASAQWLHDDHFIYKLSLPL
ncbi:Rho guanine nucleotide exchange factor [Binucleata daphniae]